MQRRRGNHRSLTRAYLWKGESDHFYSLMLFCKFLIFYNKHVFQLDSYWKKGILKSIKKTGEPEAVVLALEELEAGKQSGIRWHTKHFTYVISVLVIRLNKDNMWLDSVFHTYSCSPHLLSAELWAPGLSLWISCRMVSGWDWPTKEAPAEGDLGREERGEGVLLPASEAPSCFGAWLCSKCAPWWVAVGSLSPTAPILLG